MIGYLLGLMMGLIAAVVLIGFLAYWLCSRSNHVAVAKFINGIAQALAHNPAPLRPRSPEPKAMEEDPEPNKETAEPRRGRARERWGKSANGDA